MHVALFYKHSINQTTGHYVRRCLETLCKVDVRFPHEASELTGQGYDLYLCVDDSSHYLFPSRLRPSAIWIIDTHLSYRADLIMARRFDYVFAANKDGAERFRRDGIVNAEWLPLACDQKTHGKYPCEAKTYDVAFIGNDGWGRRCRILQRLRSEFPNSYLGRAPHEEIGKHYSQAKVVFNCGIRNDLNMRVFEALCSGTCLVTNSDAAGLTDLFIPGKHLVTYSDENEAVEIIRHYLSNESARQEIAAQGMNEALQKHTYLHRVSHVLDVLSSGRNRPINHHYPYLIGDWKDQLSLKALRKIYRIKSRLRRRLGRASSLV